MLKSCDYLSPEITLYYKNYDTTLNEKVKEMIGNGQISLRGLKDNAKIFDESLILRGPTLILFGNRPAGISVDGAAA